ncbi:MAG: 23S rRNA (uridine(2552)-2'-O)-methyltransferase RlmE [Gammaproteobacteria bacterium]|nr:23S rRNA (uridine(2552)-2'-O)-methyltransferase RlmE [Gammaproteobacteria bacterium]MDH5800465.1 23S rRNA (uridine(2552)-2'-O)-methyltransferase RlmE [Gammaproteobacteria bacterium]
MPSKSRSKSSRRWLQDHFDDPYVKQSQRDGYRSRAVYKLIEIQEKDKIIRPGQRIVDLGAAPGGWSQVASQWLDNKGKIYALDVLPMDTIENVEFIHGDFTEESVLEQLLQSMGPSKVNLVMSDMAPNISGIRAVDQPKSMYLAELTLDLAQNVLQPGGDCLMKVFQGEGFDELIKRLRKHFTKVITRKPKASRPKSREVYLLARGFKSLE